MSEMRSLLEGLEDSAPEQRRVRSEPRWALPLACALALTGWAVGGAIAFPQMLPRAERIPEDPFSGDLAFAILDDDFNRLPVGERLDILLALADRLRSMSSGDSAALAAFAAGLTGAMRERIEENIRIFGVDMMASYGQRYAEIDEARRERFLEDTAVEWSRLIDRVSGQERSATDGERLREMQDQAERDAQRARANQNRLTPERASAFLEAVRSDVNEYADPTQRASTARFLRDMTRHMRGRDISTNKPKRP